MIQMQPVQVKYNLQILLTRSLVTCPGALAWRSEAALAYLALGDRESAERLAEEELRLAA